LESQEQEKSGAQNRAQEVLQMVQETDSS